MPSKRDWLDSALYPDVEPPDRLEGLAEQVDFLARLCAAWDFGRLPSTHTVTEIRRDQWREAVDTCGLMSVSTPKPSRQGPQQKQGPCHCRSCLEPDVSATHQGCRQTIGEGIVVDEVGPRRGRSAQPHGFQVHPIPGDFQRRECLYHPFFDGVHGMNKRLGRTLLKLFEGIQSTQLYQMDAVPNVGNSRQVLRPAFVDGV